MYIILGLVSLVFIAGATTVGILISSSKGANESTLYYANKDNLLCNNDPSGHLDASSEQRICSTLEECFEVE